MNVSIVSKGKQDKFDLKARYLKARFIMSLCQSEICRVRYRRYIKRTLYIGIILKK